MFRRGWTVKEMFCRTGLIVEGDGDVFEDDDRFCGVGVAGLVTFPGARSAAMVRLPAEDADHRSADEEVDNDDEDGGDDDGLRGRFTDALCAPFGVHAEVAADGGNDESGEERLREALDDVAIL